MTPLVKRPVGAHLTDDGVHFSVWAPSASAPSVHIHAPNEQVIAMHPAGEGYFEAHVPGATAGARYMFRPDDDSERPDPASHSQPDGVHAPSEVVDPGFEWNDSAWRGLALRNYIFYELHVGTFTQHGTFEAVIPHLDDLKDLGITCIEIMPVAQFPGSRNWGYDGVYPFAVQHSYGGVRGLKTLVNACHCRGIAVCLDVVYNHLGPEGNYMSQFGPYFTDRYKTPWGSAINFDGPDSDHVRNYFIQNALRWFEEFHVDALRLDAVHAIYDFSAYTFLEELGDETNALAERLGRPLHLIAESDLNDTRIVRSKDQGGFALDAQWSDDFHHALHTLLTGETDGYYEDFGAIERLESVLTRGFAYAGEASKHRRRRHGNDPRALPLEKFVVCSQNHDQVGNRMLGERLSALVDSESLKLAAATTILSPFLPLLFMGEEYGEQAPFLFFVSHGDKDLVEAVRKGRREEFSAFSWKGEAPDPQSEETFQNSKLRHELKQQPRHRMLREFYRELIRLRREHPLISTVSRDNARARIGAGDVVSFLITGPGASVTIHFNFGQDAAPIDSTGRVILDSAEQRWGGAGRSSGSIARRAVIVMEEGR